MPIPDKFLCPISKSIMRDPFTTNCGHTFEACEIIDWVEIKSIQINRFEAAKCPCCKAVLIPKEFHDNEELKLEIDIYYRDNQPLKKPRAQQDITFIFDQLLAQTTNDHLQNTEIFKRSPKSRLSSF
jgi:hypothetical protein